MFGTSTRLLLIVLSATLAAFQLRAGHWLGWALLPCPALLIWGYFRYGTVHAAFQAHLRGDDEGVRRLLAQTRVTSLLRPQDKGYFEFLSGTVAQRAGDLSAAREHLRRAALGPMRTDNMRSVVFCHLAAVELAAGQKRAAADYLQSARDCPHRTQTDEMIAQLDEQVASMGEDGSA